MKKVALIRKRGDILVENLRRQLECFWSCLEITTDLRLADIVLVCLSSSLIEDSEQVALVKAVMEGEYGIEKRIIPVIVRVCGWEDALPRLATRSATPRKWLIQYAVPDEGTFEVAEAVADLAGFEKPMFKD